MNPSIAKEESAAATTEIQAASPRSWFSIRCRLFAFLLAGLSLSLVVWLQLGYRSARMHFRSEKYELAREAAERYLLLHPYDSDVRMLASKCYSQDDALLADYAMRKAIVHLQQISDDSPLAARARMLEGRLTFLILHQPGRAERLFLHSLKLEPDQFDSQYMLWKLHDLTERYSDCEPYFRAVFERVPESQRAIRLREWYLSQFNPLSACAELDGLLGFRDLNEYTSEAVAFRRLTEFARCEPDSPVVAAALAQAQLRDRQRDVALQTLEQVSDCDTNQDPFFKATLIEVLLELGQMDRAKSVFENWKSPPLGYRYWRIAGLIYQEVDADFRRAADAYKLALEVWPGPSDWLTMHRRFRCLALLGDRDASAKAQKQYEEVEDLMKFEDHQRQRDALAHLDDPKRLEEIVEFYRALNRSWEQQQWQQIIDRLRLQQSL